MSDEWLPIERIPAEMMDGREVRVKRIYGRALVKEGAAVFALPHERAPMRAPLGHDPLDRLTAADYAAERRAATAMTASPMWLTPDRMYRFPEPTHFARDQAERAKSPNSSAAARS